MLFERLRLTSLSTGREIRSSKQRHSLFVIRIIPFSDFFLWFFGPYAVRDVSVFLLQKLIFLALCVGFWY